MRDSIAILILNYDGKAHLDVCLSSVLSQVGSKDHVYLVDNGSIDGSVDFVRERYPQVKLIKFETNLGFATAYNRAVALVPEGILLFLNNDVEVDKAWLAPFELALRNSEHASIYGSKILLYTDRSVINHAGGLLTITGAGIDLEFMKKEEPRSEKACFVGCVSGASMLVPRRLFLDLGGFDPDFFAYFEDVDFCWRAWLAGYKVMFLPSSRVYHKLSSTMGPRLTARRVFLGEKNRLQVMLKNLEFQNALVGLLTSSVYNIMRLAHLLWMGKPRAARAVLRGDLWALRNLSSIIVKRGLIQQKRKVSDQFLMRHGLMLGIIDGIREFKRLTKLLNA
jgi:GT2 family glycosyltransferase